MQNPSALADLPRSLTIDVHTSQPWTVLRVGGDLDLHSAEELRRKLGALRREGHRRLVVDLGMVTFLDSVALGVLAASLKRLRGEGGSLALVCEDERLLRLFRITRLDKAIPIHSSLTSVGAT